MSTQSTQIMNITASQLETFGDVWKELLRQKVRIIHEISQHKSVDFKELLMEFIPEAYKHTDVWEHDYIIKPNKEISEYNTTVKFKFKTKKTSDNPKVGTNPPKKFKFVKK